MARSIMTEYFGVNAGIELAALQKNSDEAQTRSILRTRNVSGLQKRETRIKEIIESS